MRQDDNDEEIDDAKLEEMKQRIEDQFDDTETSELKGIFDDCDIDGTGRMDLKEFTRSLASLKLGLAPEGVEEIFDGILKEKQRQANSPNSTSFEITFDDFQNFWHKHGNTIKAKNHERSIHDMIGDTNARVANLERQVKTIGADVSAIKEMIAKLVARH
jgi:chaperonin cofactor prefoldin|eukprot:COSAG01_NODE_739_length_13898_cov_29.871223_11_plen_160_part_00